MLTPDQLVLFYPGPGRPGVHNASGDGPLAVLHQHVPQLGPRPAAPVHEPQRRDQHAARQHQLDARPRRRGRAASCSATTLPKLFPIVEPDCSRLGQLRQRARIPADDRPHAAGSGHDDDPRGVAEARDDAGGEAGVLRIPLGLDGAVGRPGVDRLHRRQLHRRRARPQRPASQSLLPDERRPRDHGQRSGRAADRSGERRRAKAGCSRAACSWSTSGKAA